MVDWSKNLSHDLVEEIASHIDSYDDYTRLRAVCMVWKSSLPEKPRHLFSRLPCLMFPCDDNREDNHDHHEFFSMFMGSGGKVYNIELPHTAYNKLCRGFSQGWLITVEKGPSIDLINPLTKAHMQLPPIYTFPNVLEYQPERVGKEFLVRLIFLATEYHNLHIDLAAMEQSFIQKVVLSSSPGTTEKSCIAMAIYGDCSKLAYCKIGDKEWKLIEGENSLVRDIIHYEGRFFAVDNNGRVLVVYDNQFDVVNSSPKAKVFAAAPEGFDWGKPYLVESSGELLLVERFLKVNRRSYETEKFRIWKLNLKLNSKSYSKSKWVKVKNLGHRMLFLGYNESFSFLPPNVTPPHTGNRIYFTDDYFEGQSYYKTAGSDIGVYNIGDGSFLPSTLPLAKSGGRRRGIWPPPIWIMPKAL
ncbi:F-box protein skip23 [Thalictrum thalictroides]|uniref:F-box protein skip23 n=1 Tax=Thalictrum thalictroides TaxID=46969 RepID=A0A7J6VKN5_THATH|nr:F-box protein skip23 [Thalictrum thalictroides]